MRIWSAARCVVRDKSCSSIAHQACDCLDRNSQKSPHEEGDYCYDQNGLCAPAPGKRITHASLLQLRATSDLLLDFSDDVWVSARFIKRSKRQSCSLKRFRCQQVLLAIVPSEDVGQRIDDIL